MIKQSFGATHASNKHFNVQNGAFTSSFDPDEWVDLLDDLKSYSYGPDFVVLPDVLDDANATLRRHREWVSEVHDRGLPAASVVQPGMDVGTQVALADSIGAEFTFLGGQTRWQRTFGREVVKRSHDRGLAVHIGNPSGNDGFVWAYRLGADSVDTSTVCQNEYWHYLEELEAATEDHSKGGSVKKASRQATLADGGQR